MCIHSFGSLVHAKVKDYTGPHLGVKHADANKREFTAAQIAAANMAQSKLTAGSSDTMERSENTKQGITFGNTSAGGGGSSEASKLTAGSSGVMERSENTKQGITFGNTSAGGGGSSSPSKLTAGSSGVMERSENTKQGITFGNKASAEMSVDL